MPKFNRSINLEGMRFGRLTALRQDHKNAARQIVWGCKCDCGKLHYSPAAQLRSGLVVSCGCSRATHGHSRGVGVSLTYKSWDSMRQRCGNANDPSYERYGGRGITVCDRWQTFEFFLADMGERPSRDYSIEREDVNGGYSPKNCKWATRTAQQRNRRDSRKLTANGITRSVHEWAADLQTSSQTILHRIKHGMSVGKAVSLPPRRWTKGT